MAVLLASPFYREFKMSADEDTKGPFIVWENYGYEGWQPKSYQTLKEALTGQKLTSEWTMTKLVHFVVNEE